MRKKIIFCVACLLPFFITNCALVPAPDTPKPKPKHYKHSMSVNATAYTSCLKKRNAKYPIGAWGDALKPTCRGIAVSNDLMKMGLKYETKVSIEGLKGEYVVLDKMHPKWRKKIDVYMGNDFSGARQWGRRTVTIHW